LTLLETIQQSAVDANADVSTVLRQCRLLAARLDSRPLEEWVVWESDGYPSTAEVPPYRVWPIEVRGTFSGPFQSMAKNYLVPPALLPENARDGYERWECRMSVAALEATLADANGTLYVPTGNLSLVLGENVLAGYNCIQARGVFSSLRLVEVLNAVRNRVLEFVLAVWKEAPAAGEIDVPAASRLGGERVTQIFNTVVRGGSVNLVGAVNASTVAFNVTPGDWGSLELVLGDSGLTEDDLSELQAALEADPAPGDPHAFGPKVSAWIATVTGKAASGAWKIGLGAAGSLLAQSIAKYYGL
jgi:AbiTii